LDNFIFSQNDIYIASNEAYLIQHFLKINFWAVFLRSLHSPQFAELMSTQQRSNTEHVETVNIMLSVLQVLFALVAFGCAVLAEQHRGYYGKWNGLGWYRYYLRSYYGLNDEPRIIFIIDDRILTTDPPVTATSATAAPANAAPANAAPANAAPANAAPANAAPANVAPANADPDTATPATATSATATSATTTPATATPATAASIPSG
jgi:hypothetical protein